jgi:hypothetical protein
MHRIGEKAARRRQAAAVALLALAAVVFASIGVALAAGSATRFRIVVHPQNPVAAVERDFLADAFLKKTLRWPDGEAIEPVDQRLDAPARQQFSEHVLRRSVFAVRSYWQQRIFTGRGVPPPELESDEAVLGYVRSHRGAVGYVSERAATSTVRVITLRP